jgi:hypothetical protein
MANVVIDIAAEFTGNKAFKQAESSTDKLIRSTKKLAGAIGIAFSAQAIVNFGRLAVKASLDQQAEQNRLNQLLKVGVGATTQEIALLNDQAKALERIGVVSGGNITQTQSQLATFNLQVKTIEALTPAILDYVTAEKGATASTADFKSMTNGLAQALNGNFASLTRVGFVLDENTKKQIANGTEAERANALVQVLNSTYKDFNKNLRDTDAGQMQVLANSAQEATTIIGTGLIDALKALSKENSVDNLATDMERAALASADFLRGLAQIGSFQVNGETRSLIGLLTTPIRRSLSAGPLGAITRLGEQARLGGSGGFPQGAPEQLTALSKYSTVLTKVVKNTKILTAEERKQLTAKRLKLAVDKANLALNKGEEIFDIDKIQIAAALTSQAEQLGKATSSAQVLQIANDTARLNVKRSILALEDAMAAKDEAAIIAATAKLNADLKVLSALTGQSIKLSDIKSILESLKPVDLINQSNLDAAIAKLLKMMKMLDDIYKPPVPVPPSGSLGSGIPTGDYIAPISTAGGSIGAILEYAEAAAARANAFADLLDMENASAVGSMASSIDLESIARSSMLQGLSGGAGVSGAVSGSRYAAQAANSYNITIQAGIGDPEAIARAVEDVVRQSYQRGTSATGLLAV